MTYLTTLPNEILLGIFEELSARDVLALATTCRRLNDLTRTSSIIQLILDLATYGYVLSPDWKAKSKGRSTHELARSFSAVMSRWENFDYTAKLRISHHDDTDFYIKDRVLGFYRQEGLFKFYHLDFIRDLAQPSATAIEQPRHFVAPWIQHRLTPVNQYQIAPECYHWDASQDILVYCYMSPRRCRIYIRTLSGNTPHPLAASPVLELDQCMSGLVVIIGELLIIEYQDLLSPSMIIQNWKAGVRVLGPLNSWVRHMLNEDTLMILPTDGDELAFEIYNLSTQARRLRLHLPFTFPDWSTMTTHTSQESYIDTINSTSYCLHDLSLDTVYCVTFTMESNQYFVAISGHEILNILRCSTESFKELPWSEWGPNATRWFDTTGNVDNSGQGSSVYFSFTGPEFSRSNKGLHIPLNFDTGGILFCNFNPRFIRRYQFSSHHSSSPSHSSEDSKGHNDQARKWDLMPKIQHIITEEWVIRSPVFSEDIRSRLPFRAFLRPPPQGHEGLCPDMGRSPLAAFADGKEIVIYYFDDIEETA